MSFVQSSFLGASIISYSSSVGWGSQVSRLSLELVEDSSAGDSFLPRLGTVVIGQPVYFTHSAEGNTFTFGGVLENWQETRSLNGYPVYSVTVVDPRELLAGVQLILGGYKGTVSSIPNILNIYGYLESTGFGNSGINPGGIDWNRIISSIQILTNSFGSGYGGPVAFKGFYFFVDLSLLPVAPIGYRLGGTSVDLLSAITEFLDDSGCDFFVRQEYISGLNYIRVYPVSRYGIPDLNQISNYITANPLVESNSKGREMRNETTSVFLTGGQKQDLYLTVDDNNGNIWPFWGFDANGNLVNGTGTGDDHSFDLNAIAISDIIGSQTYSSTVGEMRAALGGQDEWETYIDIANHDLSVHLGISPYIDVTAQKIQDILKGNAQRANLTIEQVFNTKEARAIVGDHNIDPAVDDQELIDRVYAFVRSYADDFYGKRFLVQVPITISVKQEPETQVMIFSHEPSTDGGYLPEGSEPLGLSFFNEDIFTSEDGKFQAFVRFENADTLDLTDLSPADYVIEENVLFVRAQVENFFAFNSFDSFSGPRAVLVLPGRVQVLRADNELPVWNDLLRKIAQLLGEDITVGNVNKLSGFLSQPGGIQLFAEYALAAARPSAAAVPILSNVETYGPWYSIGSPGRTVFEQDTNLVPWNFSGHTLMNRVANSKVTAALTLMQEGETGDLTFPGIPNHQLGDVLIAGGPNVTGIDVTIGSDGVKTSYRMRTFTPRFGVFSKHNSDRFSRISKAGYQQRRQFRQLVRANNQAANMLAIGNKFVKERKRDQKAHSPHSVIVGNVIRDVNDEEKYHVTVSTATIPESVSFLKRDYYNKAICSLDALFVPVTMRAIDDVEGGLFLPFRPAPGRNSVPSPCKTPFGNEEIRKLFDYYEADKSNAYAQELNISILSEATNVYPEGGLQRIGETINANTMALKVPIMAAGWGLSTQNIPVPTNDAGDDYLENYQYKPHKWKVGPIDLRWDEDSDSWVTPNYAPFLATVVEDTSNSTIVVINSATNERISVRDYFNLRPCTGDLVLVSILQGAGSSFFGSDGNYVIMQTVHRGVVVLTKVDCVGETDLNITERIVMVPSASESFEWTDDPVAEEDHRFEAPGTLDCNG